MNDTEVSLPEVLAVMTPMERMGWEAAVARVTILTQQQRIEQLEGLVGTLSGEKNPE